MISNPTEKYHVLALLKLSVLARICIGYISLQIRSFRHVHLPLRFVLVGSGLRAASLISLNALKKHRRLPMIFVRPFCPLY